MDWTTVSGFSVFNSLLPNYFDYSDFTSFEQLVFLSGAQM